MVDSPLLEVTDLAIDFSTDKGLVRALHNVSFSIGKRRTLGLVGESGSGKTITSLALMGLLPMPPGKVASGSIKLDGQELLALSEPQWQKVRGARISMIFQEPMTSLNPVFTVGAQIIETLRLHTNLGKKAAKARSIELLEQVGLPDPAKRVDAYPHQLSGGQRQRVMIAMAIACEPDLLICDEPTTALDVTIQKQILELLLSIQQDTGMSMLFITHDLGVIAEVADDVLVMYKGKIVEQGDVSQVFHKPQHPYTKALLACKPTLGLNPERLPTVADFMNADGTPRDASHVYARRHKHVQPLPQDAPVLVDIQDLSKVYVEHGFLGFAKSEYKALKNINLKVHKGRILGLVGESGCGKTTLGRTLLNLMPASSGRAEFAGQEVSTAGNTLRKKMQIVFQDPYASLNPRLTVAETIMEPMRIHKLYGNEQARLAKAKALMDDVGLHPDMLKRYPHEFSGGQRQRICIARALATEPEFIVCDEAVSALDVSVQAQVLNLLLDLREEYNLTYVFISHHLAVVRFVADEVAVMYKGEIVEYGPSDALFANPTHPYTQKLLASIPEGKKARLS